MEFKRIELDLSECYQTLLAMLLCLALMVFLVVIGVILVNPFNHSSSGAAFPSKVIGMHIIFLGILVCVLFGSLAIMNVYEKFKCVFTVWMQKTLEYNKEFLFNWYAEIKNLETFKIEADKFDYELDRCFYKTSSGKIVNITLGEIYKLYLQYEKNAAK